MASKFVASAEHTLTCPVCYEFYVDPNVPKLLECAHTCCQVCLQNMVIMNPGQPISCPMRCAEKTPVPAGGVSGLKTNLHLKNLAEEHPGYATGERPKVSKCTRHDEKMHLYCETCNMLACQNCYILYHQGKGHVIKDIKDTTTLQKQELGGVLTKSKEKEKNYLKTREELEALKNKIITSLQSEKEAVDKCVNETTTAMLDKLSKEGENLKEVIDKSAASNLAKLDKEMTWLKEHIKELKDAHDIVQQTSASPDYAYITQHASIMESMKRLSVKDHRPLVSKNQHPVKFVKQVEMTVKLCRAVKVRQLEQMQELGIFQDARKVAISSHGLLAVSDFNGKAVFIYQEHNGQYEKKICLLLKPSNRLKPVQIVICPDDRILVARCTGIEVYSSTGNYQKTISTKTSDGHMSDTELDVQSLAALEDGRILAGDRKRKVITVHDTSGDIIKTLKTDIEPWHVASIQQHNKIAMSDSKANKLSVIDIESGAVTLNIDIPQVKGICYDEETQCLFIARSEPSTNEPGKVIRLTGVIEQYCSFTGKLVACLTQGLYYPIGMALIPDGRLAVADKETVKIYQVT